MKKAAFFMLPLTFLAPAAAAEPSALEIAQRAANDGSPSSLRQRTTMTLIDGKDEWTRTLVIARSRNTG